MFNEREYTFFGRMIFVAIFETPRCGNTLTPGCAAVVGKDVACGLEDVYGL